MTRLDALTSLRDKVSRGVDTAHDHADAFPSESAYGHCTWHDSHRASMSGSTEAAISFHKAVLPGWIWMMTSECAKADDDHEGPAAAVAEHRTSDDVFRGFADDPARALLLADFEALIAQEEAKG